MGVCVVFVVSVRARWSTMSVKLCPVSSSPTLVLAGFGSMVVGCGLTVALAASWHQVVLAQCEAEDAVS